MSVREIIDSHSHIIVDASRCRRMRLDSNECRLCEATCPCHAVSLEPAITIDARQCTQCELCVSECPDDALQCRRQTFSAIVERLGEHESPVLACRSRDSKGHVRTPCLGWLTEEHLIALATLFPTGLQLNLTRCSGCLNGHIVERLVQRMAFVITLYGPEGKAPVTLIENADDLDYRPLQITRRGFFSSLRHGATRSVGDLLHQAPSGPATGYSDKILPSRRAVLNTVLPLLSEQSREMVLKQFYYNVHISEHCDLCLECEAICATGALSEDDRGRLLFDPNQCTGCGLCEAFCSSAALRVEEGVEPKYRDLPDNEEFRLVKGVAASEHAALQ